jgi:hypothetical protein
LSSDSFQRISTSDDVPRSTRIPASVVGLPVKLVLRLTLLSSIFTCVVFTELTVPVTFRFPPTSKFPAIVTSSGRPIVTAADSPLFGETVTSFAVPTIVAT